MFVPVWAAYPAAGFGDRDALPTLRTDAAARLLGWGRPVSLTVAFLHLAAEGARAGLRELDRLERRPRREGRPLPGATSGRGCLTRSMRCCGGRR